MIHVCHMLKLGNVLRVATTFMSKAPVTAEKNQQTTNTHDEHLQQEETEVSLHSARVAASRLLTHPPILMFIHPEMCTSSACGGASH